VELNIGVILVSEIGGLDGRKWAYKQALADAIAEARSEELARLAADLGNVGQLDLFGAVQSTQVTVVNGGSRGPGRPVGARNKRTDEAARFYMSRFGDPLSRVEIAAIPILAQGGRVHTNKEPILEPVALVLPGRAKSASSLRSLLGPQYGG
jgi:hypothetical protein